MAEVTDLDGVVFLESVTRRELVEHLATGMARYRKIPLLTRFELRDDSPPPSSAVNSAQRLKGILGRHTLADPAAVQGRRILLVDDRTDSGWTLAVAARELRRAGAASVFPFVLAIG